MNNKIRTKIDEMISDMSIDEIDDAIEILDRWKKEVYEKQHNNLLMKARRAVRNEQHRKNERINRKN